MNSHDLKRFFQTSICSVPFLWTVGLGLSTLADTTLDTPGNFNPILPGYFADPTIKKFGATYYLYATTDGNGGGRGPATVWVSKDFVNWTLVPMNWPTTEFYWAPDVVHRPDGRYYLYYNQPCRTFGAVSDSPTGPWTPLTPGEGLIIPDRLVKDVITLDTQVFEDRDGTFYAYWGTWGIFPNSGCGIGVLNPDMKSFSRFAMIPNTQAKEFFEAPFMIERNGVYYFTYSSGSCHDASYRVQYAVGSKPDGEFRMGPNNPILATSEDGKVHGPGHHSILQQGDEYFIVYHRHDVPVTPNGMHRQVCADRLMFERDGEIKKIEPSHQGVGYLGAKSPSANLAFNKPVSASSHYRDTVRHHEYLPAYAVDDNNATLWRPGDNRMGHWLQVDLGSPQRVRRTHTQFEYGTWFYQYLIEHSLDGKKWSVFADRRSNTRWGSPLVDSGDVEARYLRLTVTGVEYPGLFGALWNFKAFADVLDDPLLALADKAFDDFVAPKQKAMIEHAADVSALRTSVASTPDPANHLLINVDAADLQLGAAVGTLRNQGAIGGEFLSRDAKAVVGMASGCKAIRFSGKQILTASFSAPRSLAGNSSFTVAAWVNNPEIAESECLVSWAGRGGPDGATAQIGYGTQREFGAVGHWGFADMGFRGPPPAAGEWHHLAVVFDGVIERVYVDGQLNNSEAKMLLMHEGRPVFLGASEPGTEYFDGYLASLRVYDMALGEQQVKRLAADKLAADVLVHIDSSKLDYGPIKAWTNNGSVQGVFLAAASPPQVRDVQDRIAAQIELGQSLELGLDSLVRLRDFTVLAGVANPSLEPGECALEVEDGNGVRTPWVVNPPVGAWHQVALVYRSGAGALFVDGQPTVGALPPAPGSLKTLRLGGGKSFTGALSRVQLFARALSAVELSQLYTVCKSEAQRPSPSPAEFSRKPAALSPTAIAMIAQPGKSEFGTVEYRFTEISGNAGASSSGWIPVPFFLDDGLQPNTRYAYTVAMRDPSGNVSGASPIVEAVTESTIFTELVDTFAVERDYLAGTTGSVWDGVLSLAENSAPEVVAARGGTLRLQSKGTVWDGGKPLGPFLYKLVTGDFVAQVRISDYADLAARRTTGNNDGGLMVRVPKVEDAGPGEDLVQLNFFPIWGQGNMVTSLDSGSRPQRGNGLAWDAHRYLQIIRQGSLFYFRTSTDGEHWMEMPGSPVERPDMDSLPLQVGLYHASYGAESSHVAFSDFRLITRK